MSNFVYRKITVTLADDTDCDSPIITVSDNPHIPKNSIGIISWMIDTAGDAFTFSDFKWCADKGFLHPPITEDQVVVTVVNNQYKDHAGDWGYRVRIKTPDGKLHWTEDCKNIRSRRDAEKASISAALATGPMIINDGS